MLTEKVAKADKLRRYVVAFGGEVLPMYQCSTATHVVYPKGHKGGRKGEAADDAVHVSAEWLEKSIKVSQGCQIYSIYLPIQYSLFLPEKVISPLENLHILWWNYKL